MKISLKLLGQMCRVVIARFVRLSLIVFGRKDHVALENIIARLLGICAMAH